ncbi:hypothetical protein Taro_037238 [Colocasia esculenta]|uniref:Uncharacterized protein n=1 Tax=Colocasia esculenta TaxID=4460 RepID=A0A843VZX6_COLES|nr:hypothetical protein [Colocasia esculenta]
MAPEPCKNSVPKRDSHTEGRPINRHDKYGSSQAQVAWTDEDLSLERLAVLSPLTFSASTPAANSSRHSSIVRKGTPGYSSVTSTSLILSMANRCWHPLM